MPAMTTKPKMLSGLEMQAELRRELPIGLIEDIDAYIAAYERDDIGIDAYMMNLYQSAGMVSENCFNRIVSYYLRDGWRRA